MRVLLRFPLSSSSKEAGDEGDLSGDVSLAHPSDLFFAKHVHHLVSRPRSPCGLKRKEAEPRFDQPLEKAMVLLDQVVEVFDLP